MLPQTAVFISESVSRTNCDTGWQNFIFLSLWASSSKLFYCFFYALPGSNFMVIVMFFLRDKRKLQWSHFRDFELPHETLLNQPMPNWMVLKLALAFQGIQWWNKLADEWQSAKMLVNWFVAGTAFCMMHAACACIFQEQRMLQTHKKIEQVSVPHAAMHWHIQCAYQTKNETAVRFFLPFSLLLFQQLIFNGWWRKSKEKIYKVSPFPAFTPFVPVRQMKCEIKTEHMQSEQMNMVPPLPTNNVSKHDTIWSRHSTENSC